MPHRYQRALDILAKFGPQSPAPAPQGFPPNVSPTGSEYRQATSSAHSLHSILLSNTAACFLQLRKWNAALHACNELLEKLSPVAPDIRLKTLVRRCKVFAELGDWEAALSDLRAVKELSVDTWAGLAEVARRCTEMKQSHATKQRSV